MVNGHTEEKEKWRKGGGEEEEEEEEEEEIFVLIFKLTESQYDYKCAEP